jgi:hypothetical protein
LLVRKRLEQETAPRQTGPAAQTHLARRHDQDHGRAERYRCERLQAIEMFGVRHRTIQQDHIDLALADHRHGAIQCGQHAGQHHAAFGAQRGDKPIGYRITPGYQ